MRLATISLSFFLLSLCNGNANAQTEIQLRFGVYTSDKASDMVRQFRPLMNVLEERLQTQMERPVRISMQVASSYEQGIADIVTGSVDFSRFGPASYVIATGENPQLRLLAMESNKGSKRFRGMIIVHADSALQSVPELAGARFAFGDRRSTIGRYLSQQHLLENGLRATDLGEYVYLERHDAVANAVASRQFDAGAVKSGTMKKYLAKGAPLRVLAHFDNVTKPWIARAGLDPEVFDALRTAMLTFDDQTALASLGKEGFLAGSDSEYDFVRKAMTATRSFHD